MFEIIAAFIATFKLPMNPVPYTVDHGPGLLKPFVSQIWISVRGCGRIMVVGSCGLSLGSGIARSSRY